MWKKLLAGTAVLGIVISGVYMITHWIKDDEEFSDCEGKTCDNCTNEECSYCRSYGNNDDENYEVDLDIENEFRD